MASASAITLKAKSEIDSKVPEHKNITLTFVTELCCCSSQSIFAKMPITVIKVWSAFAEEACGEESLKTNLNISGPHNVRKHARFGTNLNFQVRLKAKLKQKRQTS